jgi:hypothetical protein
LRKIKEKRPAQEHHKEVKDRINITNKRKKKKNLLYTSRNFITVTKSRRVRLVSRGAQKGQMRNAYKFESRNLKGEDHLGDRGVDRRILLKQILKK